MAHSTLIMHGRPEFRGLMLVGDLTNSSQNGISLQGAPIHFGYLA